MADLAEQHERLKNALPDLQQKIRIYTEITKLQEEVMRMSRAG